MFGPRGTGDAEVGLLPGGIPARLPVGEGREAQGEPISSCGGRLVYTRIYRYTDFHISHTRRMES